MIEIADHKAIQTNNHILYLLVNSLAVIRNTCFDVFSL